MRNCVNCIVSFVLLILLGCNGTQTIKLVEIPSCSKLNAPGMTCTIPDGFKVPDVCYQRDDKHEYECSSIPSGWQITSPEGYGALKDDIDSKLKELAKLRRRHSKSLQE